MGFFDVPALNRKQPSTSFKIGGRDFAVDVLAPMKGRETTRPVHLTDLGTFASPLRHLDYLLEDLQPAVLLYEHGIMVNVPAPGRFAIHKCVISQKRPAAFAAKATKDRIQAEQVFQVLLENRPSDVSLAYEAGKTQGDTFVSEFRKGLGLIDETVAEAVVDLIENKPV